jgi:hypothetical protein
MPEFNTVERDTRELHLGLGLMLLDAFSEGPELVGEIAVTLANAPERKPFEKRAEAAFFFFELAAGNYTVQVRSNPKRERPYYLPLDLPLAVPMVHPTWPAFPDAILADAALPLDHPDQFAPYRNQRRLATLQPTTRYPFPAGAALIRGTVYANNAKLAGVTVSANLQFQTIPPRFESRSYLTEADGGFVLFFRQVGGTGSDITLSATHPNHPAQNVPPIKLERGMTVVKDIIMAP